MATPQQKASSILQFAKTNHVPTVQRQGYVKVVIYVPPLPNDLKELRQRIIAAVATENRDVLDGESLDRNGLSD
jgi:hypothetical protein